MDIPRTRISPPLLLVLVFLLMLAAVLSWSAYKSRQEFSRYQREIAAQSVNGAANEITLLITGLRTSLRLLRDGHGGLLAELARDPENTEKYERIERLLAGNFPDYYAFTIANADGNVIYDDLGDRIGPACRKDIRAFAAGRHETMAHIHPGPTEHHFDIMLPWRYNGGKVGVFFASFKPSMIARLLQNSEIRGHRLMLLRDDTTNLIEISAAGGREDMKRPIHLGADEVNRVLHSSPVHGTRWRLVDLPSESLFTSYRGQMRDQTILIVLLFVLVSVFMLLRIRQEERQRAAVERALRESNDLLEQRVQERTRELAAANENLKHEIEERIRAEQQMQKLTRVVEQTDDTVLITNREGITEYVNPAFEKKTGYRADEVLGRRPNRVKSGMHDTEFYERLWASILNGKIFRDVFINRRKDGSLFHEEKTITPLKDENGDVTHFVATGKDITERVETQKQLQYLAHHDALTGLPNRTLLIDRLDHAFAQARRAERLVAVLFLDLDRFKTINDSLGHGAGDALLKAVADRLQRCVRKSDSIARLGGDEFTIVLEGVKDVREVIIVAEKILEAIARPISIEGHEVFVTTSIGVTLFPIDDEDVETVLKHADTAMYRAKKAGGNTYEFFTADMSTEAARRLEMENRLRYALEREEFELFYQPRIDLRSGRLTGAEALLRWRNPEAGLVSPAEFIPLLEETGMIIDVGEWVLQTACRDFQGLSHPDRPAPRVAVNLSTRQFQHKDLLGVVKRVLDQTGLEPGRLDLEITESLLADNIESVVTTLNALHDMGIYIAIDDFGTGYSSLSYLKRFPIDILKIDQSFVRDVTTNPDDAEIVKAIVAMAHSLRMNVVAEGVETQAQLELLRRLDCEEVQGYLFSPPLPLSDFISWWQDTKKVGAGR